MHSDDDEQAKQDADIIAAEDELAHASVHSAFSAWIRKSVTVKHISPVLCLRFFFLL